MSKTTLERVDTHCHLWEFDLANKWLGSDWPSGMLKTVRPVDVAAVSKPHGVTSAIAIECGLSEEENAALQRVARESDYIRGYAPHVDLEAPDLDGKLKKWKSDPKCVAVRMRFEGHPDRAVLKRPSIIAGLKRVAEHGLIFEYLVRAHHLADIVRIHEQVPGLKAIVEHLAKPDFKGHADRREWEAGMAGIAKQTGVLAKLSLSPQGEGVAALVAHPQSGWPVEAIKPFAHFMIEKFGVERLMWGSDYPISLLTSDYAGTLGAIEQAIGPMKPEVERKLFHDNAIRFYGV